MNPDSTRQCKTCGVTKQLSDFYKHRRVCIECVLEDKRRKYWRDHGHSSTVVESSSSFSSFAILVEHQEVKVRVEESSIPPSIPDTREIATQTDSPPVMEMFETIISILSRIEELLAGLRDSMLSTITRFPLIGKYLSKK